MSQVMSQRSLFFQITKRTLLDRYKGSFIGLTWVILYPLSMVMIYTFVFGEILQAKWTRPADSAHLPFSISVFSGLLIFLCVAEVLSKAPTSISSQLSYVKRVKFPLMLMAWVDVTIAYLHAVVAWAVMCLVAIGLGVQVAVSAVLIPCLLATLIPVLVAMHWLVGAISVYLRDLEQIITPFLTFILFLSPVFYALDSVNQSLVGWLYFNPLTFWMEGVRGLLVGDFSLFTGLIIGNYLIASAGLLIVSRFIFNRLQCGFADVL